MPEYGSYQKSSYINELEVKDTDNITEAPDSSDTITDKNNAYISEFIPKSKTCLLLRKWAGKSIFTCKSFNRALSNEDITLKYVPIYIFKTNASAVLTGAAVKIDDKDDSAHRITRTHYYNITHKATINNYRKAFSATEDMSDIILEENMIVSCEPGIYIYGYGGVRIEDLVCVKNDGIRNLTNLSKELIEI